MGFKQKSKRNRELYRRHLDNPNISLRKLGKEFGISGERVRQIYVRESALEKRLGAEYWTRELED